MMHGHTGQHSEMPSRGGLPYTPDCNLRWRETTFHPPKQSAQNSPSTCLSELSLVMTHITLTRCMTSQTSTAAAVGRGPWRGGCGLSRGTPPMRRRPGPWVTTHHPPRRAIPPLPFPAMPPGKGMQWLVGRPSLLQTSPSTSSCAVPVNGALFPIPPPPTDSGGSIDPPPPHFKTRHPRPLLFRGGQGGWGGEGAAGACGGLPGTPDLQRDVPRATSASHHRPHAPRAPDRDSQGGTPHGRSPVSLALRRRAPSPR